MKYTVQRLVDVLRLYFQSKLTETQENIVGDPLSTEFIRPTSVLKRLEEIICSSEVLQSYGPALVLLQNLEAFQNCPNNFQLFHTTEKMMYEVEYCPYVSKDLSCPEFVAKSEMYQMIVEKLLESTTCPNARKFNRILAISWANRIQRENLKNFELISRDHVLNMLRDVSREKSMEDVIKEKKIKKKWDERKIREKLAEFFDGQHDKELLHNLRSVIYTYSEQYPVDKNPNALQQMVDNFEKINTMAKNLVYHNPGALKPFDKCKKITENIEIGLRCFDDPETLESFSMAKDVEVVINAELKSRNKKPLKAGTIQTETAEEKKLGIVKTMSETEVLKSLKKFGIDVDGTGIFLFSEPIRRTSDDVVIPTISYHSRHCKLAFDTFVEFFEDLAVKLRLFEMAKPEDLQSIVEYFENLDIFDGNQKNRYFLELAEVDKRRTEALEFLARFVTKFPLHHPVDNLVTTNETAIADEICKMSRTIELDTKTLDATIFEFKKKKRLGHFRVGHLIRILARCARIQISKSSQKLSKFCKAQCPLMFGEKVELVIGKEPAPEIEAVEIEAWESFMIDVTGTRRLAMVSKDGRKFFNEETVYEMCLERVYKSLKKEDMELAKLILNLETDGQFTKNMIEESDAKEICDRFLKKFENINTTEYKTWSVESGKSLASGIKITQDENFDVLWEGVIDNPKLCPTNFARLRQLTEQKWRRLCAEDSSRSLTQHYFDVMFFCTRLKNVCAYQKSIDVIADVMGRVSVLQNLEGKGENGEWRIGGLEVVKAVTYVLRKELMWNSCTKDILESWERQWYTIYCCTTITIADFEIIVHDLAINNWRFTILPSEHYSKKLLNSSSSIPVEDPEPAAQQMFRDFRYAQQRRNFLNSEPEKRVYSEDKIIEVFKLVCPTMFNVISMQNYEPCEKLEQRAKSIQECFTSADFAKLIEMLKNPLKMLKHREDFKNLLEFEMKNGKVVYRKFVTEEERNRKREEVLRNLEEMKKGMAGKPKFIDMSKKEQVSEVMKKSETMKTVLSTTVSPFEMIRKAEKEMAEKTKLDKQEEEARKMLETAAKEPKVLEKSSESTSELKPKDNKKSPKSAKPTQKPKTMPREKLVQKIKEDQKQRELDMELRKIRETSEKSPKSAENQKTLQKSWKDMNNEEFIRDVEARTKKQLDDIQSLEKSQIRAIEFLSTTNVELVNFELLERSKASVECTKSSLEKTESVLKYLKSSISQSNRATQDANLLQEAVERTRNNVTILEELWAKVEASYVQKLAQSPIKVATSSSSEKSLEELVVEVPTTPSSLSPSPKNSPKKSVKKSGKKKEALALEVPKSSSPSVSPSPKKSEKSKKSPKKNDAVRPEVPIQNEGRRVSEDSGVGADALETRKMKSMQKSLKEAVEQAASLQQKVDDLQFENKNFEKKNKELETSLASSVTSLKAELSKKENRIQELLFDLNNDQNKREILNEKVRTKHENAIQELKRTNAEALNKANCKVGTLQADVKLKASKIDELHKKLENVANEKDAEIRELRRELAREKAEKDRIRNVELAKFEEEIKTIKENSEAHILELKKDVLKLMLENSEQKEKLELADGIEVTMKEQNDQLHFRNVYLKEKNKDLQRQLEEAKTQLNVNTVLIGNRSPPRALSPPSGPLFFRSNAPPPAPLLNFSIPPPPVQPLSLFPYPGHTNRYSPPRPSTGSNYRNFNRN